MKTTTPRLTDPYARALGQLIRRKRTDAGLSQADLASGVHVSQAAVSLWEKGNAAPSPATLNKVMNLLSIEESEYISCLRKAG